MTTQTFDLTQRGKLQAQFLEATTDRAAIERARDYGAQLAAELYLARLFGNGIRIRPS